MKTGLRLLYFLRSFWPWVGLSICLGIAALSAGIGLVGISTELITRAALQPGIAALQVMIVGVRFFGISKGIFRYLERLISHSVNLRLIEQLRGWLYRHIEPLAPACFSQFRSGDLVARLMGDIEAVDPFFVRGLLPPIATMIVAAGLTGILSQISPSAAWVFGFSALMGGIGIPYLIFVVGQGPSGKLVAWRENLSSEVLDLLTNRESLLLNGHLPETQRLIQISIKNMFKSEIMNGLIAIGGNGAAQLVVSAAVLVVLWICILSVEINVMAGVLAPVVLVLVLTGLEAIPPLTQSAFWLQNSIKSAERIFSFTNIEPTNLNQNGLAANRSENCICEIKRVSFTYPGSTKKTLNNINFSLLPRKKIALVGPSGSGKSTVLNLLLRFYDPQEGLITIGGVDSRHLDPEQVRELFSVVLQEDHFFTASLRQNLLIGNPMAKPVEMIHALESAGLGEWFSGLKDGLDTEIGIQGMAMSAGEQRRLSIARALLKPSPYLLLDEPTANLDSVNAHGVMESLKTIGQERGIVLVSHWLVDLEDMDEILVFNQGELVEKGNYQSLVHQGAWFARWVEIQKDYLA